ncbi:MAG: hypothetical protein ACLP4V_35460, partial [Methylocella sp.]
PAIRRLQTFRHLHACSGCFRLERSPGGTCTHWKAPPFHGAHPLRKFGSEFSMTGVETKRAFGRYDLKVWDGWIPLKKLEK